MTRFLARVFPAACVLVFAAGAAQAATELAVLGYPTGNGKLKETDIELKAGAVASPFAGKLQRLWVLKPGDTLKAEREPAPRQIQFYRRLRAQPSQLMFTVAVKYFLSDAGWQPAFRIEERFLVIEQGGDLVPVPRNTGELGVIQLRAPQPPNHAGYFPALEFGLPNEAIAIDFWIVK